MVRDKERRKIFLMAIPCKPRSAIGKDCKYFQSPNP
jgi:hypothetical protein